ncbi:uncharacterized protein [Magallana gigas]|uniref:uncharacterized protein isoform X4 n=1 Tax=Magallana gigas TaxID=29159 RepID=UPI003340BBFF
MQPAKGLWVAEWTENHWLAKMPFDRKGQCPSNVGSISITTCSRALNSGPRIYVDFNKINQPCECTVALIGFAGDLLVTAETLTIISCNTKVVVNGSHTFGCPIPQGSSVTFTLSLDQSINVEAEYSPTFSPGTFYQCLGFQGGDLFVFCDRKLEGKTSMAISTTSASSTTRLSSPSSVVSFTELIATSAINKKKSSEELKSESLLSLQIPLAIFVVISTLSTILNIYFYINIKSRNKSKKDKTNSNVIMSNRGGSEPNAETYTELGNTAARESENQYESITRQENNMNTNVL